MSFFHRNFYVNTVHKYFYEMDPCVFQYLHLFNLCIHFSPMLHFHTLSGDIEMGHFTKNGLPHLTQMANAFSQQK